MTKENVTVKTVDEFIASLRLGEGSTYKNLSIYPVFSDQVKDSPYTLLSEGIESKRLTVTEVDEGGSVPTLKVINGCDRDVILWDFDVLEGGRQTRSLNTDVLVGRGKELFIPVSCVESGRWNGSRTFRSSSSSTYSALRRIKSKSVTRNLKERKSYMSGQSEIWEDIRKKQERMHVNSETEAMDEIFTSYEEELGQYERVFTPCSDQVGLVVAINGKVVGCDVFGVRLLDRIYEKLLRSYCQDALDQAQFTDKAGPPQTSSQSPTEFIQGLKAATKSLYKSVGKGKDVRIEMERVNGSALVDKGVVHLSAFAEQEA